MGGGAPEARMNLVSEKRPAASIRRKSSAREMRRKCRGRRSSSDCTASSAGHRSRVTFSRRGHLKDGKPAKTDSTVAPT